MKINSRKGVVLLISSIVMAVILVMITAYFSVLLSEKKASDMEKGTLQALGLAEAGVNHGLIDLRVHIDQVNSNINNGNIRNANQINVGDLQFLRTYGNFSGTGNSTIIYNLAQTAQDWDNASTVRGNYVTTVTITSAQAASISTNPDVFVYYYNYRIESQGIMTSVTPNINKIVVIYGSFNVTATRANFARYALFTSHHTTPSGGTVWFTANTNFSGPVHTNDRFSFANNPSGHFTQIVTQHENKARFHNNGWPVLMNAASNPPYDLPIFDQGFQRGADLINLPSTVSQADLKNQALGTMSQPGTNGIYVPNSGGCLTGGIYIRGDASVAMATDANNRPTYTITRGTNTKLITVDYTSNQTLVTDVSGSGGTAPGTYCGIPDGVGNEGSIIYAQGDITGFSGVVQQDTPLTVSSERDIVITNNVTYQLDPRVPGNEHVANVLGILAWGGDVRIGSSAPNDLDIHGVVMAPHGKFTVDGYNSGPPRGTATLLGGAITDFYGPFGQFSGASMIHGYGRNFIYDSRMLGATNPPYFPYMDYFTSSSTGLDAKPVWQDQGV